MTKKEEILKPYGSLDVLGYYSQVSQVLKKFLRGREIAVKVWLPKGIPFFLKRGSNSKPLFIEDLRDVNDKMLKLRAEHGLSDVGDKLTGKQALIWEYFVPRKLMDFFYACNGEHPGKPIDRIFIDIDKGKEVDSEIARKVAKELVNIIKQDEEFAKLIKFKIFLMWTGSSFHVYLLLDKNISLDFYNKHLAYHKNNPFDSFTGRWSAEIKKKLKLDVQGGHEKTPKHITLDPSGTPSGKLARVPFSLHMKKAREIDGVAVPLSEKELEDKKLIKRLKKLTPEEVLKSLNKYSKLL